MHDLIPFLPSWGNLATFMAAALALNLTPGADMTYVMSRAIAQGRGAGLASALGIGGGSVLHTLLAAGGVSALLATSETGFLVLKYVGAAYLAYLAWRLLSKGESAADLAQRTPASLWRIFGEGVLVNLFNPKVALFILAFLPQFVEAERGLVWAQILLLGTLFNISGTTVNALVALATARLAHRLRGSVALRHWMNRICGAVLAALAVRLAISGRG